MKRRHQDPDMPIGKLTPVVVDLPSPAELAKPFQSVKITIALNKQSVDFFKRQAKKHHSKYQRMMREVLDLYASRHHAA